jgi:hypothetical protein
MIDSMFCRVDKEERLPYMVWDNTISMEKWSHSPLEGK